MNKKLVAATFGALLFGAATGTAQMLVVTPEQETTIREYVTAHPVETVQKPSNFELIVGAVIPDVFKPGELAENTIPDKKYQYVVVDGQTVLIDPATRKVVHIMK